jgi:hypothetical protein
MLPLSSGWWIKCYQTTWCTITEDRHLHTCHHENLKSHYIRQVSKLCTQQSWLVLTVPLMARWSSLCLLGICYHFTRRNIGALYTHHAQLTASPLAVTIQFSVLVLFGATLHSTRLKLMKASANRLLQSPDTLSSHSRKCKERSGSCQVMVCMHHCSTV